MPVNREAPSNWLQHLIDSPEWRGCTARNCTTCGGSEGERLFGSWIDAHTSRNPDERAAELAEALGSLTIRPERRKLIANLCDHLSPGKRNWVSPAILTEELRADARVQAAIRNLRPQVGSGSSFLWAWEGDED